MDVGGKQRSYLVAIPNNYDSNKFYKLVFAWHPGASSGEFVANMGYYGLQRLAGDTTIFVAADGLGSGFTPPGAVLCGNGQPCTDANRNEGITGWGPQDVPFAQAMLDFVRGSYCIDDHRIFAIGFSMGGMMSNTVGCSMGGIFRAIAPMGGSGPGGFGASPCMGQVAAMVIHGVMDMAMGTSGGKASRDYWVKANHCTADTVPVDPAPCVAYQGCDAGFPVIWCEWNGGHTLWPPASKGAWDFFSQF